MHNDAIRGSPCIHQIQISHRARRRLILVVRRLRLCLYKIVTSSNTKSKPHSTPADTTAAVDEFMTELVHPFKSEVQAIRQSIFGAAPGIAEGIKWKAPSYRTHEYFATTNLREKEGVGVILHLGAKVREIEPAGLAIDDPARLLKWLAPDRAGVRFMSQSGFQSKKAAFENLIRSWVKHV